MRHYQKSRAAISIFLIIVLFTNILLGGLFIDASRILLAKRAVRNAADSAARSALSYYDPHMAGEYGMFAVEQEKAEKAFKHYFKTNVELASSKDLNLLSMSVKDEDITVAVSQPLMDNAVMLDSMSEYAKYRSIVDTSIGVIEKLKSMFGDNGSSKKVYNATKDGKDAMDYLKKDVTELSNSARALLHSGVQTNTDRAKNAVANILRSGGTPSAADKGYADIQGQIDQAQAESNKIDGSKETYTNKINQAEESVKNAANGPASYYDESTKTWKTETPSGAKETVAADPSIPDPRNEASKEQQAVNSEVEKTQSRFNQLKTQIDAKTSQAQACNTRINNDLKPKLDVAKATETTAKTYLNQVKENKQRDRYNFLFGDNLGGEISALKQKKSLLELEVENMRLSGDSGTSQKEKEIQALESRIAYEEKRKEFEELNSSGASHATITSKQAELDSAVKAMSKAYEDAGMELKTPYDEEIQRASDAVDAATAAKKGIEKEIETEEKKRDKLIEEIEALYDKIPAGESSAGEFKLPTSVSEKDSEAAKTEGASFFANVLSTFQQAYSEMSKIASNPNGSLFSEDGLRNAFGINALLEDVFGTIEKLKTTADSIVTLVTRPEEAANSFLFTNYVFETHSFLTSQTSRSSRHFQVGEIEYILEGKDSQAMCVVATLKNIAFLRLTINFVDYFVTTQAPLITRAVVALGRAGIQTLKDMASMVFTLDGSKTATCALCPSLKNVKLTYSDHLRLWMLIQGIGDGGRAKMMNNLQTLMRDTYTVNGWGDTANLYTSIHGEVQVEVNLIMLTLPMFEKVLPEDNQILKDGKFIVRESITMAY